MSVATAAGGGRTELRHNLRQAADLLLRVVAVAALVGVVTLADLVLLPRVDAAFFYFLPIVLAVAWFGNWGVVLVPISLVIYHWNLARDLAPELAYPYATDVVKLLSFSLIALLTSIARERYREVQQAEREQEVLRIAAESRGTRLETLYRVARAANASHGAAEFLSLLLDETRRLVPHIIVATALERRGNVLIRRAVYGPISDNGVGEEIPVGQSIAGRAVLSGEPLVLEGADFAEQAVCSPSVRALHPGAALAIPLVVKAETRGVIVFFGDATAHFTEDDIRLLQSIASEAALVLESLRLYESLRRSNAELQERQRLLDDQLQLARNVQNAILEVCPKECSLGPLDVASFHASAWEVGGDLIRIVPHEEGAALFVGDVMGKGVPAALLMTMMTAKLSSPNAPFADVAAVLAEANRALVTNVAALEAGGFITVFYAHIRTTDLRICYASAGHPPAILLHDDGRIEEMRAQSLPLGIFADAEYVAAEWQLAPGDRLVLFTDGLTEARNPAGDLYGTDRLTALLAEAQLASAGDIRDRIVADVTRFMESHTPSDDIAVLVVGVGAVTRNSAPEPF